MTSPLDHRPARMHVISMQRSPEGDPVAICACGWRDQRPRHEMRLLDDAIMGHWPTTAGEGR